MHLAVMVLTTTLPDLLSGLDHAQEHGFSYVQVGLPPDLDAAGLEAVKESLARNALTLVAVDGYENGLAAGPPAPGTVLRRGLANARELGCDVVVTWSGNANTDLYMGHPDNASDAIWQATVTYFKAMALVARENGVRIAIEPFHNHVASTPERVRALVAAIDEPEFGCLIDPPNVLKAHEIETINDRLDEIVDTLAPVALLAHAKDIRQPYPDEVDNALDGVALPQAGEGIMDFARYVAALERNGIPALVVEHHTRATLAKARDAVAPHLS